MDASGVTLAAALFDRFADAFTTFDATYLVGLVATPGVALRRDGSIVALTAPEDVLRYYQAALDDYRRDGYRSSRWSELAVTPMGRCSLLAAVTWELLRDDGSVAVRWRQCYSVSTSDGEPKILASAQHVE